MAIKMKLFITTCFLCIFLSGIHSGCRQHEDLLLGKKEIFITLNSKARKSDCDTILITCIDYRFAYRNQEFLNNKLDLQDNYDHISIPGSIYNLVNPNTQEVVLNKILSTKSFHLTKRIIIIAHKDCGGYGGSSAFGSDIAEEEYLSEDLRKAREILLKKYPILRIDLYIESLTLDGVQFKKIH